MKRDMNLIRNILFYIEENYKPGDIMIDVKIKDETQSNIYEHCKLMYESGLIQEFKDVYTDGLGDYAKVGNLTNEGFDYLEKIRDNSTWSKTKEIIKNNGLPFVIETVKEIAGCIIKTATEGAIHALLNKVYV